MFETHVDTSGLTAALKEFSKVSRKSMGKVTREQSAIMVAHLIGHTPPGEMKGRSISDRGGITTAAKKRGEASVAADIISLLPTVRMADDKVYSMIDSGYEWGTGRGRKVIKDFATSVQDLKRIHRFARSPSTGRVRTGSTGQNMALTRAAIRSEYIKQQKKKVGTLNAGWLKAARELKTAKRHTPTWITRHQGKPGGVHFRTTKSGLTITMANNMPYMPENMASRVSKAIERREHGMKEAMKAIIERNAKQAERKQGR